MKLEIRLRDGENEWQHIDNGEYVNLFVKYILLRLKEKSVACRVAERHCLRDNGAESSGGWSCGGV